MGCPNGSVVSLVLGCPYGLGVPQRVGVPQCIPAITPPSPHDPPPIGDPPSSAPRTAVPEGGEADEDPHKRRSQLLSVLLALAAMLGYAVLSGIVAVRGGAAGRPGGAGGGGEEEEDEEE